MEKSSAQFLCGVMTITVGCGNTPAVKPGPPDMTDPELVATSDTFRNSPLESTMVSSSRNSRSVGLPHMCENEKMIIKRLSQGYWSFIIFLLSYYIHTGRKGK
jgi:hypothetical protein